MYKIILGFGATVGGIAGAYIPYLWGDDDMFSGMSILLSVVGGIVGIWLAFLIGRRIGA